jgi:hypothetical protein
MLAKWCSSYRYDHRHAAFEYLQEFTIINQLDRRDKEFNKYTLDTDQCKYCTFCNDYATYSHFLQYSECLTLHPLALKDTWFCHPRDSEKVSAFRERMNKRINDRKHKGLY